MRLCAWWSCSGGALLDLALASQQGSIELACVARLVGLACFCTSSWDMVVTCTIIGVEVSVMRDIAFSPYAFPLGNADSSHLYRWSSWLSLLSQLIVPLIWATLGLVVLD